MTDIQAVVFDLYGTLIHLEDKIKTYTKLFTDVGLRTSKEFRQARGIALTEDFENLADFVKRIKPNSEIDLSQYEQEIERERTSALVYPETKNVLEALRKREIQIGLISNLASPYKEPFFKLRLKEYFDEILFSCEVGLRKPSKKIYEKMINTFGINPSQVLMIGDKVNADVEGPKSIGMNAIHLDRTNFSSKSISNLEEIFKYL